MYTTTAATSDLPLDDYTIARAGRFGVEHLIGTPEQDTALAWIANATADPTRLARPGAEIALYAGTTEVSVPANSAYDAVEGDEAALFKVKVPHQWLYLHPSKAEGSEWVGGQQVERRVTNRKTKKKELRMVWEPAVYAEGMLYAVITLRAIKSGAGVMNPSVPVLARAFKAVQPRQMTNLMAQAEDAGLITVEGSRSGRVAPVRRWHTKPVDESRRTSPTRMKAWAAGSARHG